MRSIFRGSRFGVGIAGKDGMTLLYLFGSVERYACRGGDLYRGRRAEERLLLRTVATRKHAMNRFPRCCQGRSLASVHRAYTDADAGRYGGV